MPAAGTKEVVRLDGALLDATDEGFAFHVNWLITIQNYSLDQ